MIFGAPSTNREYTANVKAGRFPLAPRVPLDEPFKNEAGVIQNLLLEEFASVALIDSVAGAVRSNHYHKTDWHFMFVLSGEMHYYWKLPGLSGVYLEIFRPGELMFTPPRVVHATYFPVPTRIMTFARNIRDHEQHEADLVRCKLIEIIDGQVVVCE